MILRLKDSKMKYDFKYIIIIIFVFSAFMAQGQEVIKLEKAMEIARVNNSKLRSDALLIKYQHALVNTAYNFAPVQINAELGQFNSCLLYTSPSPRDRTRSRMPSSA